MLTLLSIAWACLIGVLLVRAVVQYRTYEVLAPSSVQDLHDAPLLSVVIPARNEAANIRRCVTGLLQQDYSKDRIEIIVVDDNSTDGTAQIVREMSNAGANVRLVEGAPLPESWTGKPFACWQGAAQARGEWLCFLDADTVPSPHLLSTAVMVAEQRRLDLLSLEPFQELGTFWERLIIPSGFLLLAFFHDLRRINDPNSVEAAANGQFILIRRAIYRYLGGHEAVRSEICEDKALASCVKNAGGKIALQGAEKLVQTRMYRGLAPLWEGLSKNLTQMIGTVWATAWIGIAAIVIGWTTVLLPLQTWPGTIASSARQWLVFAISFAGSLALICTQIGTARYFRIPWWYGLLLPLGYTVGAVLVFNSIRVRINGRVSWKGRSYRRDSLVLQR